MLEKIFRHQIGQKVSAKDDNGATHVLTVAGYYALELAGQPPLYRYVLRSAHGTAMIDINSVEDQQD